MAFLNSRAIEWLLDKTTGNLGTNTKIGQKSNFLKIQIPIMSQEEQELFNVLVDQRLSCDKEEGVKIDKAIDNQIYKYYCLTDDEIAIIEDIRN